MKNPNSKFGIIRNALGCTQDQLATYLGVHRGFLSNVEKQKRVLPNETELKLLKLYQLILKTRLQPNPEPVFNNQEISELSIGFYLLCESLEKRTNAMATERENALNTMQYANAISSSNLEPDENLLQFLKVIRVGASVKLGKNSDGKLTLLKARLRATKAAFQSIEI